MVLLHYSWLWKVGQLQSAPNVIPTRWRQLEGFRPDQGYKQCIVDLSSENDRIWSQRPGSYYTPPKQVLSFLVARLKVGSMISSNMCYQCANLEEAEFVDLPELPRSARVG